MFQGILRAATAVLLFAIAVLVYVNYIRSTGTSISDKSELATAPEVPKVPLPIYNFEAPSAPVVPIAPAEPVESTQIATAPRAVPATPERVEAPRPANRTSRPRAEIIDNDPPAEIVELPPSPRSHMSIAQEPAEPALRAAPAKRTHTVQPGESLWVISRKYLGAGDLNGKLAEYNGITAKDRIRVGQVLQIPDLSEPASFATRREAVSEDYADHEDTRRLVSRPGDTFQTGAVNASVKHRY